MEKCQNVKKRSASIFVKKTSTSKSGKYDFATFSHWGLWEKICGFH